MSVDRTDSSRTYSKNSQEEYSQRISQTDITMPDGKKQRFAPSTIKRWVIRYRKSGIDGLRPNIRIDNNKSRKLSDEVVVRLKWHFIDISI